MKGEVGLRFFKEKKKVQYHQTIMKRLEFNSLTLYHPPIQEYSPKYGSLK